MAKSNLGLAVFQPEDSRTILEGLGLTVNARGAVFEGGERKLCDCCNTPLKEGELGAVLPGSVLFYCERPGCLAQYAHRKIRRARKGA